MKKSAVSMLLTVLMVCAFAVSLSPSVKANASEVSVLSYSWYIAPENTILASTPGDFMVVGEMQNVGSNIIENVSLQGTAYDSNGQVIAEAQGDALVHQASSGQKFPFFIDFMRASMHVSDTDWTAVARVAVTVLTVQDTSTAPYTGLSILGNASSFTIGGKFMVTGDIENTGDQIADNVWVITTFYNASGTAISLNYTSYLSSSLNPNAMAAFYASPADYAALSSQVTNYAVQIDSVQSAPLVSPTQPTSAPSNSQSNANQASVIDLIIVTVVVLVVIAAYIFFLLTLKKRRESPPPPPPPPPPI